ncbi:hypothetical protein FOZ63_032023 [Perkinsus olseni]|uniref:N-acetyltransferase domain-containing protein n=1 Tax=Perkinsus olseni TaxID=32597 RepID=A0A7J6SRQ4_PEROL|nr:hypothetical protein FOZ63_032023 [Perkinsus olseni]
MRLFILGHLAHVVLCRTAGREAALRQHSGLRVNEEDEVLEYRPWDVIDKTMPYEPSGSDRLFVAVNSKGNVVGREESIKRSQDESEYDFASPDAALAEISFVWISEEWRNRRVASTMLPRALEDVGFELP